MCFLGLGRRLGFWHLIPLVGVIGNVAVFSVFLVVVVEGASSFGGDVLFYSLGVYFPLPLHFSSSGLLIGAVVSYFRACSAFSVIDLDGIGSPIGIPGFFNAVLVVLDRAGNEGVKNGL